MILLNLLVIVIIIIIVVVFLQTTMLTRRRQGDSLRDAQEMGRQTAFVHGMSAREAELYHESLSIGVCISRFALRVASANHLLTQTKLLSILNFFQGATPAFAQDLQAIILRDIQNPETIDWEYNFSEAKRILNKPRWSSFAPVLLVGLIRIAQSDGPLGVREYDAIVFIMTHLGWTEAQTRGYFKGSQSNSYQPNQSLQNDYEILGADPQESLESIKKKYRELVRKHHPDTYAHLGAEMQKAATERFQAIQAAWEKIQSRN